jgi:hypothetical protein
VSHRTKYIVVMYGDLNRGEKLNVGVLAWDGTLGVTAPVTVIMRKDWTRIHATFPWGGNGPEVQQNVTERMLAIKTLHDFRCTWEKMGPYTPFEFTEERGSIEAPEKTALWAARYFLQEVFP